MMSLIFSLTLLQTLQHTINATFINTNMSYTNKTAIKLCDTPYTMSAIPRGVTLMHYNGKSDLQTRELMPHHDVICFIHMVKHAQICIMVKYLLRLKGVAIAENIY